MIENFFIFIFNNSEFTLFDIYFVQYYYYTYNIFKNRLYLIYRMFISNIIERHIRNIQRHRKECLVLKSNFI